MCRLSLLVCVDVLFYTCLSVCLSAKTECPSVVKGLTWELMTVSREGVEGEVTSGHDTKVQ